MPKDVRLTKKQEELRIKGLRILARMMVRAYLKDLADANRGYHRTACLPNLNGKPSKMSGRPALKRVRVKAGGVWNILNHIHMSQNQLAHVMGSTSGYLSQLLNGQRNPSPKMRRRLLQALGNPPFDEVFSSEDAHE